MKSGLINISCRGGGGVVKFAELCEVPISFYRLFFVVRFLMKIAKLFVSRNRNFKMSMWKGYPSGETDSDLSDITKIISTI